MMMIKIFLMVNLNELIKRRHFGMSLDRDKLKNHYSSSCYVLKNCVIKLSTAPFV